jgi:hypothetical protein
MKLKDVTPTAQLRVYPQLPPVSDHSSNPTIPAVLGTPHFNVINTRNQIQFNVVGHNGTADRFICKVTGPSGTHTLGTIEKPYTKLLALNQFGTIWRYTISAYKSGVPGITVDVHINAPTLSITRGTDAGKIDATVTWESGYEAQENWELILIRTSHDGGKTREVIASGHGGGGKRGAYGKALDNNFSTWRLLYKTTSGTSYSGGLRILSEKFSKPQILGTSRGTWHTYQETVSTTQTTVSQQSIRTEAIDVSDIWDKIRTTSASTIVKNGDLYFANGWIYLDDNGIWNLRSDNPALYVTAIDDDLGKIAISVQTTTNWSGTRSWPPAPTDIGRSGMYGTSGISNLDFINTYTLDVDYKLANNASSIVTIYYRTVDRVYQS